MDGETSKLADLVLAWFKWDEEVSNEGWNARNSGEWDDARSSMVAFAKHIKYGGTK